MVGMPIYAVRPKCHNNLRFDAANMGNKFADDFFSIRLIHISINVIKEIDFAQAKMLRGTLQLSFADSCDSFQAGVGSLRIKPASLPTRRTDQIGLYDFGGITCYC